MKIALIIIAALVVITLAYFIFLGFKSHSGKPAGLIKNQLAPCAKKPNCICTEYPNDTSHYTDAIHYTDESVATVIQAVKTSIKKTGGVITRLPDTGKQNHYIAANYTSTIFRYIDDFEVRIDNENQRIHIRSASRVGHSDMGANLKRIKRFKNELIQELKSITTND
ncbi:hypothetical protein MNBD_GAMMA09-2468 [hydrothermal vent metagenome]|uniref:DUF1499 domain-containing protein n=1 Tax=hydrothermal vent metagenome TaxID=652676 RepID=A0A3B0XT83_9ZZZZ